MASCISSGTTVAGKGRVALNWQRAGGTATGQGCSQPSPAWPGTPGMEILIHPFFFPTNALSAMQILHVWEVEQYLE